MATPAGAGNDGRAVRLYTDDQLRQRYTAERWRGYDQRQEPGRAFGAPLGGYNDYLGQPSPYGTERPGYVREHKLDYEIPGFDYGTGLVNGQ